MSLALKALSVGVKGMKEEHALEQEAGSIQKLLEGKVVSRVLRPRPSETCIEFSDGTRLFIEGPRSDSLGFSVTGGQYEE